MTVPSARFGRDRRIRKAADFAGILKSGRRGASAFINLCFVPARGAGRIGISASTRVGGSVQRNRARRLVREHYRQAYQGSSPYDIVINLKPGFAELSLSEARKALDEALSKAIAAGKNSGRRADPRN